MVKILIKDYKNLQQDIKNQFKLITYSLFTLVTLINFIKSENIFLNQYYRILFKLISN